MALNEVLGLLLPVAWHDLTQVMSLPQAAVALQCQSVSAGPARARDSEYTCITSQCRLTSRSKQNTDDTLKAYLTASDIMWIIAKFEIRTDPHARGPQLLPLALSSFKLVAASRVRERQRAYRLSLWRADHLAEPRVKRKEQWAGLGHGQCDPQPLPRQASHIVRYIV